MPVIKLTIAYDGTNYHGWQNQTSLSTVQGKLEKALFKITGESTRIHGAGRTDAGVHAVGQVAHFTSSRSFKPETWVRGLNALLPPDIAIRSARRVLPPFHARFSAWQKTYTYFIYCGKRRSPFLRQTAWHLPYTLDIRKMRSAAKRLLGSHDFTSFCATVKGRENCMVNLKKIEIIKLGERIQITLTANRFLQYMVRNIVGFLVEVGRARRTGEEIPSLLEAKNRTLAGPTAPPQGLFLVRVSY